MSKLVRRVGNFLFDQAAKQYERSMTRKLNAFGERKTEACCNCSCILPLGSLVAQEQQHHKPYLYMSISAKVSQRCLYLQDH